MKSEDIARICGVSRSTVSRVINNYDNVPEKTREKVMKVIEEYQYQPNSFARSLAGKKSNTIGIFIIISSDEKHKLYKNDFFTNLIELIIEKANEKDYFSLVSIISTEEDYAKLNKAIIESRIDGAIIIGTNKEIFQQLHLNQVETSLVLFDFDIGENLIRKYKNLKLSTININDAAGIELAVKYLYDLGHRKIGFVKGNDTSRSGITRFNAYKSIMGKFALPIDENHIINGNFMMETTYKDALEKINKDHLPTAYISANDSMAFALIKALNAKGLDVPGDISIVGYDGTERGKDSSPSLTTLRPDYDRMANKAIETIVAMINNEPFLENTNFSVELITRESSKSIYYFNELR